jgi:hypothetical protein
VYTYLFEPLLSILSSIYPEVGYWSIWSDDQHDCTKGYLGRWKSIISGFVCEGVSGKDWPVSCWTEWGKVHHQ